MLLLSLMSKIFQKSIIVVIFGLLFSFAGCQSQDGKASIFSESPQDVPDQSVHAAIISADPKKAEKILEKIPQKEAIKTLVIVAHTDVPIDGHEIFTYSGFIQKTDLNFDTETLAKLKQENSSFYLYDKGAIEVEFVIPPGLSFLKKNFPQAKFVLLYIHKNATTQQVEGLGRSLGKNLPEAGFVLAVNDFLPSDDPGIQQFQFRFMKEVLTYGDVAKFDELPMENQASLALLAHYLAFMKSQKAEIIVDENETIQVVYANGEPLEGNRTVFIVSFGDIMLGRSVRDLMNKHGLDYPFQAMDQNYLRVNDLLLGNLEGPIAKKAVKTQKTIAFRFREDVAPVLKKYYFDILGLANNHTFDMGKNGYKDTREILEKEGIVGFGNPAEISEESVAVYDFNGQKIAFFGLEEVIYTIDEQKAAQKIKELTSQGYKVIPVIHWGIEYTHKPNERQRGLAHRFIDAGAVAIIAHHPHVVQAYENYKNRPIFYSLGNAIFDQYFSQPTQEGLSIALAFNNEKLEVFLVPFRLDRSQMRLMNKKEKQEFLKRLTTFSEHTEKEKQQLLDGHILLDQLDQ